MAYTHKIEIQIDGLEISGEINFDHGTTASFKMNQVDEMTISQHRKMQEILEALVSFNNNFGEITKLEVTKK